MTDPSQILTHNALFGCRDDETLHWADNGQQRGTSHSSLEYRATRVRYLVQKEQMIEPNHV